MRRLEETSSLAEVSYSASLLDSAPFSKLASPASEGEEEEEDGVSKSGLESAVDWTGIK